MEGGWGLRAGVRRDEGYELHVMTRSYCKTDDSQALMASFNSRRSIYKFSPALSASSHSSLIQLIHDLNKLRLSVLVLASTPLLLGHAPLPSRHSPVGRRRQAVKADSVLGDRISNSPSVDEESLGVKVGKVVTDQVVIPVVGDAGLTTVKDSLLGCLEHLSASEETTGRDTDVEERTVVRSAAELGALEGNVVAAEVVFERLLGLCGTGGTGQVEARSVAVIDAVEVVGGGDHVEVKV